MTTGTSAVVDEASGVGFDAEEIPTGRRIEGTVTESGFWGKRASDVPEETSLRHGPDEAAAFPPKANRKVAAASGAMRRVLDLLEPLARADVTVTLIGETGTGKDVLARTIHQQSSRRNGPFVVFDCGSVAANLAESELLGHERGSFTGAVAAHVGAFERAHGGTLFLDEIGELPLDLQPRLLRVLETRRVRRVGGAKDRPLDVRVLAATHRNLRADLAAGTFRQDLFFRLGAAVVTVPPLRDRLDDLPLLVQGLLADLGHDDLTVDEEVLSELGCHDWPGNIRELKNVLACAVAFLDDATKVLERRHLRVLWSSAAEQSSVERLPLGGQRLS